MRGASNSGAPFWEDWIMNYEILHGEAFPIVKCDMIKGERITAESDAMIAMDGNLRVEGKTGGGGFMGGLARKFLAGESFFVQEISAAGNGSVLLGHSELGGITDVQMDGSYSLIVQKNGFLASTDGINVNTKVQNLAQGVFSREGLFVLNVSGRGTVFISSFGAIHELNIGAGEEVVVDNGHLVAWPDYMDYKIEKASSGWISSMMSGEGLVCRFRGPGTVLIQTRKPSAFAGWLSSLLPSKG